MKKIYHDWNDVSGACLELARQLYSDNWKPDYIVGITRGGLIPAVMISQYLNVPMHTLGVSLRDGSGGESNLWMAEDAFGYICDDDREVEHLPYDTLKAKKILIVDDINDSGATISWIKNDWSSSCLPSSDRWDYVWGENVRFATLTNNLASKETVDYSVWEVNKSEDDCWIVYPWEDYWYGFKHRGY